MRGCVGKGPQESHPEDGPRGLGGSQKKTGEGVLGCGVGRSKGKGAGRSLVSW